MMQNIDYPDKKNVLLPTDRFTWLLLAVGTVAAILFIVGYETSNYWLRMLSKPLPVICLAIWVARQPERGRYGQLILGGLLLGMAGDILLEAAASAFLFGLVAFLLGHVLYILAFVSDSRRPALPAAVASFAYGLFIYWFLSTRGDLGDLAAPVAVYVLVICTMLWRAASRRGTPGVVSLSITAALAGALFFTFSDTALALGRFGSGIELGRHTVILTYWIGQSGISLSVRRKPPVT